MMEMVVLVDFLEGCVALMTANSNAVRLVS